MFRNEERKTTPEPSTPDFLAAISEKNKELIKKFLVSLEKSNLINKERLTHLYSFSEEYLVLLIPLFNAVIFNKNQLFTEENCDQLINVLQEIDPLKVQLNITLDKPGQILSGIRKLPTHLFNQDIVELILLHAKYFTVNIDFVKKLIELDEEGALDKRTRDRIKNNILQHQESFALDPSSLLEKKEEKIEFKDTFQSEIDLLLGSQSSIDKEKIQTMFDLFRKNSFLNSTHIKRIHPLDAEKIVQLAELFLKLNTMSTRIMTQENFARIMEVIEGRLLRDAHKQLSIPEIAQKLTECRGVAENYGKKLSFNEDTFDLLLLASLFPDPPYEYGKIILSIGQRLIRICNAGLLIDKTREFLRAALIKDYHCTVGTLDLLEQPRYFVFTLQDVIKIMEHNPAPQEHQAIANLLSYCTRTPLISTKKWLTEKTYGKYAEEMLSIVTTIVPTEKRSEFFNKEEKSHPLLEKVFNDLTQLIETNLSPSISLNAYSTVIKFLNNRDLLTLPIYEMMTASPAALVIFAKQIQNPTFRSRIINEAHLYKAIHLTIAELIESNLPSSLEWKVKPITQIMSSFFTKEPAAFPCPQEVKELKEGFALLIQDDFFSPDIAFEEINTKVNFMNLGQINRLLNFPRNYIVNIFGLMVHYHKTLKETATPEKLASMLDTLMDAASTDDTVLKKIVESTQKRPCNEFQFRIIIDSERDPANSFLKKFKEFVTESYFHYSLLPQLQEIFEKSATPFIFIENFMKEYSLLENARTINPESLSRLCEQLKAQYVPPSLPERLGNEEEQKAPSVSPR